MGPGSSSSKGQALVETATTAPDRIHLLVVETRPRQVNQVLLGWFWSSS